MGCIVSDRGAGPRTPKHLTEHDRGRAGEGGRERGEEKREEGDACIVRIWRSLLTIASL